LNFQDDLSYLPTVIPSQPVGLRPSLFLPIGRKKQYNTAPAMAGDKERALLAGFTEYIEKPIEPETFMAEIEEYI